MTREKEYFVYLLNCYLNNKIPSFLYDVDWQTVYNLSQIHNVCAIVTSMIKKLPSVHQPVGVVRSSFNQQLGYTLMSYDKKCAVLSRVRSIFNQNNIDYMFVKGALLKDLYPNPEFRTSGDFDIIVRPETFDKAVRCLLKENAVVTEKSTDTYNFKLDDMLIELHMYADVPVPYFENMFSISQKYSDNEYVLDAYHHLLYVICHMMKHLAYRGAGIRMLMDVDVIVRSDKNFDADEFYDICTKAGVVKSAKALISLSNYFFDTPVKAELNFSEDEKLLKLFEKIMLDGGSFGFEIAGLGDYYLTKNMKDEKLTFPNKVRGFIGFLFPSREYIKKRYAYASKNFICLVFGYLNRILVGLFRRKRHSQKTINSIFNDSSVSSIHKELLNLLEIEKNNGK